MSTKNKNQMIKDQLVKIALEELRTLERLQELGVLDHAQCESRSAAIKGRLFKQFFA